jgi:hypothetical protein
VAQKLGAALVVWEHRYYGKSFPHRIAQNVSATYYEHLTVEQALADVAYFAWNFSRPNLPGHDLTPGGAPWLFAGASYSGIRAAYMRMTHPTTIYAAYTSSAPVRLELNREVYA